MKLGCDSDIVVRQLFNPLCIQMIHWFSKRHSPYGVALMEVLTVVFLNFNLRVLNSSL